MATVTIPFRSRGISKVFTGIRQARYADAFALLALVALTFVAERRLLTGGLMIGMDAVTLFYPAYSLLGERLASGDIPGWNPYQFSGAPLAADPQSGWMYWPAMLLFTLLPLAVAAKGFIALHVLGAGLGMYALARALRMNALGALTAAIAYQFTSFLYERSVCCFEHVMISAWMPIALLSMEMAIRSRRWLTRGLWWGAGGLAVSQMLAAWLGQGSYYALLALGGYAVYRTLLSPPEAWGIRARLSWLALHGGAVLAVGFGLAAAALLPRLEYNALSNLAGGYSGTQAAVTGGWGPIEWAKILQRTNWYAGGVTVALALAAPFAARLRYATPYWTALALGAIVLSSHGPTPLHWVLYRLLPFFGRLHPHNPERILLLFYLCIALLAGAVVSALWARGRNAALLAIPPGVGILALLAAEAYLERVPDALVPAGTLLVLILTVLWLQAYPLLPRYRLPLAAVLLAVLFADLFAAGRAAVDEGPGRFKKVDLGEYYAASGAARWLQARAGPFRYFGYDPEVRRYEPQSDLQSGTYPTTYRYHWSDIARGSPILVNNRATLLRLQDIQGYRPIHLERYDEYMEALNSRSQEYREANVLRYGVTSPLLDLLNVRYVVVPRATVNYYYDLDLMGREYSPVYADRQVKVYERPTALPRAWVVHSARQVDGDQALWQLDSTSFDPTRTALLETSPPLLAQPSDPQTEETRITSYEPDRITLRTRTDAPGLLVLSEVYYPAWKAYVDGKPASLLVANYLFRAVPLPEGVHEVELRYESQALTLGLAVSAIFYGSLAALGLVGLRRWWRSADLPARLRSLRRGETLAGGRGA